MVDASAVSRTAYRDAMARLPSAVNIVTTGGEGAFAGFTASAVCSVTDEPPTLLVCINRASSAYLAFAGSETLCVNVASPAQAALAALFGGRTPMPERFAAAQWHALSTGAPVLVGAAASFDCRVARRMTMGTHDVLFCEALAIAFDEAPGGLAYYGRRFHELPHAP